MTKGLLGGKLKPQSLPTNSQMPELCSSQSVDWLPRTGDRTLALLLESALIHWRLLITTVLELETTLLSLRPLGFPPQFSSTEKIIAKDDRHPIRKDEVISQNPSSE